MLKTIKNVFYSSLEVLFIIYIHLKLVLQMIQFSYLKIKVASDHQQ